MNLYISLKVIWKIIINNMVRKNENVILLFTTLSLLVSINVWGQEPVEVIVVTPGTLQEVVKNKAPRAVSLKVKGLLNVKDINTLSEMGSNTGTLRSLDISAVEFVVSDDSCVSLNNHWYKITDIKTLPDYCFECTNLQSMILPSIVENIGDYAFRRCRNLKDIVFGRNNRRIGNYCFNLSAIEILDIPDNITEVGMSAFNNIGSLVQVSIGRNVQILGNGAFANSNNITEVTMRNLSPLKINANCFTQSCYDNATLKIMCGYGDFYRHSAVWNRFKHIEEIQDEKPPFMLTSWWNQKTPFNDSCPENTVAGCGAIAIAQIMNYYNKPSAGFGQVQYYCKGNVLVGSDFSKHNFDWDNIRGFYGDDNSEDERKAIANLVYMAGLAAKVNYTSKSEAKWHKMMWGAQHYLHFSPKSRFHHRRYYSTAEWTEMLRRELETGKPVLYCSSNTMVDSKTINAHIYVIDGRNANGEFHCNYGNYGSNSDQFTSLNYINYGNSTTHGYGNSNYHHCQSMATDFYPEDGLTDNDYDYLPIALSSPMILERDAISKEIAAIEKAHACFKYSVVFFENSVKGMLSIGFYRNGVLKAWSDDCELINKNDINILVDRKFSLPKHLEDGEYEMSVISRSTDSSSWIRGWNDAPNIIPVTVSGGYFFFHIPDYHCGETNLRLNGIPQIINNNNNRVVEFTVCNPSENNFEGELRVAFDNQVHSLLTSIYDGQSVKYHFLVDSFTEVENIQISYFEVNSSAWVSLTNNTSDINEEMTKNKYRHLSVYTLNGMLLKQYSSAVSQHEYKRYLNQLPSGLYLLRDTNGVRKYIKKR